MANSAYTFKMQPLPKPEYLLMQAMIKKYQLDSPCELFTCLLRLGYETISNKEGNQYWIQNIIANYRDNKNEERTYELPDQP